MKTPERSIARDNEPRRMTARQYLRSGPRAPISRQLAAFFLGSVLAVAALGGWIGWNTLVVEGQESCVRCRFERDVDGLGPIRFRSEPRDPWQRAAPDPTPCAEHEWVRSGCWRKGGTYAYLAPGR